MVPSDFQSSSPWVTSSAAKNTWPCMAVNAWYGGLWSSAGSTSADQGGAGVLPSDFHSPRPSPSEAVKNS